MLSSLVYWNFASRLSAKSEQPDLAACSVAAHIAGAGVDSQHGHPQ
jgi:hypothetical protein